MKRFIFGLLAVLTAILTQPAYAQTASTVAIVVSSCNSAGFGRVGFSSPLTVTTGGVLCSNASGGGGDGTSSDFNQAFPASGTAAGMKSGANMVPLISTSGTSLDVNVVAGSISATSAANATAAAPSYVEGTSNPISQNLTGDQRTIAKQSGTWNIGTVTTVSAVTAITNALPAGTNVLGHVITDTGSTTAVTGTVTVSGTVAATQSGGWTVTANAGTNLNTSLLALESGGNLASLVTQLGAVTASPTANTVNDRLKTINTTLGSPFQAGGSIGNTTFASTQSGTWNITNISGTISLPTGAATASNQTNASAKTQIVDGSGNVIASTSNNLNVQCANCSGSGASAVDEASFTAGSSVFAPLGGFFQTTATSNALTNGQQGFAQMTAQRALFANLRNASGTEVGTSSTPLQISLANTGSNATSINVACTSGCSSTGGTSSNFNATFPTAGTAAGMLSGSNMVPFTTSDNTSLNVAVTSSALPTGAAIAANQQTDALTNTQLRASAIPITGSGTAGTAATGVVTVQGIASGTVIPISDGGGSITVDGTVTANLGTIGGAATAANQTAITGSKAPGTAATNSILAGGVYTSGGITLTTGQQAALQVDSTGALLISGSITASNPSVATINATVPSSATYVGMNNGGNIVAMTTSDGTSLNVAGAGVSSGADNVSNTATGLIDYSRPSWYDGSTWDRARGDSTDGLLVNLGANNDVTVTGTVAATQSGTWNITNISGTVSLPTGASTAAKQPALGTAGSASSDVITVQGIASMTPLIVGDGSGALNVIVDSGTLAATQSGTWTTRVVGNAGAIFDGATGAAVPANVLFTGLSDGTNLRGWLNAANALNSTGVGLGTAQTIGQFDDTSPTSITENQFGNLRISANRNLYGTIRDAAGNERGANVSAGNALLVDASATTQPVSGTVSITANSAINVAQVNGATTLAGNGASGTGAQRVTIANDSTGILASIGSITSSIVPGTAATNLGKAEDAALASGDTGVMALAVQIATPADSAADSDYSPLQMKNGLLFTSAAANTVGGTSLATLTAANSTNATNVKASAGSVYGLSGYTISATAAWLSLYNNSGTPTCGTSIIQQYLIPGSATGAGFNISFPVPKAFSSGIAYCLTTGIAGTGSVAASSYVINVDYK